MQSEVRPNGTKKTVGARVDPIVLEKLQKRAARAKRTLSDYVRLVLEAHVSKRKRAA